MDPEKLFLYTYADLQDRLGRRHPLYVYLRAAALIRQLIGGGGPLIDQANAGRRLKIDYLVLDWGEIPRDPLTGPFLISAPGMDENPAALAQRTVSLTRSAFLMLPIASDGTHTATVNDIIKYVANIMGGVHTGHSDAFYETINAQISFPRVSQAGLAHLIEQIARCVLWSLRPLYEALSKQHGHVEGLAPEWELAKTHPDIDHLFVKRTTSVE